MSYSVPGPGHEGGFFRRKREQTESVVAQARQSADQLSAGTRPPDREAVSHRPAREEERRTFREPPVLDRLLEHEGIRSAAHAAGDLRLADRALVDVVGDLDELLDSAATHLRGTGRGRSRQHVQEALPHLVAMSGVAALPLADVAEFLGLPREQVDEVLRTLARNGGISPAERHQALRNVEWLREQLRQVEVTKNHSLLERVLEFVSKFVLLWVVTIASAASGAFAVEEPVVKEVIKTAVVGLVAAALQLAANHALGERAKRDRATVAGNAHAALLADLPQAHALWDAPAYDGEHVVLRTRIGIRCCVARVASIPLDWPDKRRYWDLLDAVNAALNEESPADLARLLRTLAALRPPAPR
ncbi:hypothetical protein [Amycolatopsis palatopharyngis]|uniref:hypothetical protein n=1 Tax=Amycolatopsis palatopharyngis TaxID=187982 RepID=UPI000E28004B|nr:hypothetical protein [Amycolatopsis palatopharyngis]